MSKFRLLIWDYTNCKKDEDPEEIETFFEHKTDTEEDFDDLIKIISMLSFIFNFPMERNHSLQ